MIEESKPGTKDKIITGAKQEIKEMDENTTRVKNKAEAKGLINTSVKEPKNLGSKDKIITGARQEIKNKE